MPSLGYAVCGEARSGSIFLSRLLRATGVLGDPFEFFHDRAEVKRLLRDPQQSLMQLAARASTPNGVYGLKIFSPHFDNAVRLRWPETLPALHFVHLTRRDMLGQAISLTKALQNGQYKRDMPATGGLRYDRRAIADSLARIAYGQARWSCWFARNGINPLPLVYEEVVDDPNGAIHAVADHIGIQVSAPVEASKIELRVQRDATSDEWRERFLAESGARNYLDGGLLFSRFRRGGTFARWFLGPRA